MKEITLLAAIAFFVFGLLAIFAKDFVIRNKERKLWLKGESSEWTPEKETASTMYGCFCIFFSILLLIRFFKF